MSDAPIIALRNVQFRWSGQSSFAITVPNFTVHKGETVLLLGSSGSGKSTLLSLICGTILANTGHVSVDGTDLKTLSGWSRDRFRADHIGIVFQQFNLLPFGTVLDNIVLPLQFAPKRRHRCLAPKQTAMDLCQSLALPQEIALSKSSNLSVGQQQRFAVARALIGEPPILIADEPTSSLDETAQSSFLNLMFDQVASLGSTLVMVSHDPRLGQRFDRVVQMDDIVTIERHAT